MNIQDQYDLSVINVWLKMREMKKIENMTQDQIETLQHKRLIHLLKNVIKKSDFYRCYYEEHGINLKNIDQISIEDLPVIDKKTMMDNYDDFVCDHNLRKNDLESFLSNRDKLRSKYKGIYEVLHTSGSSGRIGIFAYGPKDWATLKALALTRITMSALNPFSKVHMAYYGATDGHYAGVCLTKDAPRTFFKYLPVNISHPIQDSIDALNSYKPDCLIGYSSGIYLLALEQLKGGLRIRPKRIVCSADSLTVNMAETIYNAFHVTPIESYTSTESIGMAAQCRMNRGLHLFNDCHLFEIIKANGEPAKSGESGNLMLTSLYNYTQPLIRYRTDDVVVLDERNCSCGCPFPLIKKIAGRVEDSIHFEKLDGSREYLHPIVFVEFYVAGLEKLQIVQTGKNRLMMKAVIAGDREAAVSGIRDRMDEILRMKKLDFVQYDVNIVDDIPNDPKTEKYRLIIRAKELAS